MWSSNKSAHSCLDMCVDDSLIHRSSASCENINNLLWEELWFLWHLFGETDEHYVFFLSQQNRIWSSHECFSRSLLSLSCRADVFMNWVHGSTSRLRALMLILPQVRRGRAGAFLLARPIREHQTSQCVPMYISIWIVCVCMCAVPSHVCYTMGVLGGVCKNK